MQHIYTGSLVSRLQSGRVIRENYIFHFEVFRACNISKFNIYL